MVCTPVNFTLLASRFAAKAVVAICVVFVPAVAVGASGVPVNVGLAKFAFNAKPVST